MNGDRTNIDSTCTLGMLTYNNDEVPGVTNMQIADDWRSSGVLEHATNVMSFLTQTYFLSSETYEDEDPKYVVSNYIYLDKNYS
jgi:hypothetical protein